MTREEAKREMLFAKREVIADSYIDRAYDAAIKALEQPEIIRCEDCKLFGKPRCAMKWDDYDWAEPDGYCHLAERREEGGK